MQSWAIDLKRKSRCSWCPKTQPMGISDFSLKCNRSAHQPINQVTNRPAPHPPPNDRLLPPHIARLSFLSRAAIPEPPLPTAVELVATALARAPSSPRRPPRCGRTQARRTWGRWPDRRGTCFARRRGPRRRALPRTRGGGHTRRCRSERGRPELRGRVSGRRRRCRSRRGPSCRSRPRRPGGPCCRRRGRRRR